ncbi:glycoside hydrolase family 38 N-terminal domain-containing protein [Paenibacillus silvisoli]|uniref:glycoside hydrolase family 38 N-terminal domain-containing protein n=1 Tax=Paenibacillus silvisoli TaxID=3110539 RepID=UPI002804A596|nr:hypothetical protein [Paenibacillus silvisoli]
MRVGRGGRGGCIDVSAPQMRHGRVYFQDKFGAKPTTAINFDSFGHSRGLVQLMRKAGYDSYLFMRPDDHTAGPDREFRWIGFDGSEVMALQTYAYNTLMGQARRSIENWLGRHEGKQLGLFLWGVGNHGGGPSRVDLDEIGKLMSERSDVQIVHSSPERYFAELAAHAAELPGHANDLNPRFVGCYTSMIRIKQKHRLLENELFMTEKIVLKDNVIQLGAFKQTERGDDYVLRLFEPTGSSRETELDIPLLGISCRVSLAPFEVKTFRVSVVSRTIIEAPLMEEE